jgi:hypothetical protein
VIAIRLKTLPGGSFPDSRRVPARERELNDHLRLWLKHGLVEVDTHLDRVLAVLEAGCEKCLHHMVIRLHRHWLQPDEHAAVEWVAGEAAPAEYL